MYVRPTCGDRHHYVRGSVDAVDRITFHSAAVRGLGSLSELQTKSIWPKKCPAWDRFHVDCLHRKEH
jgi:hypothetical protein